MSRETRHHGSEESELKTDEGPSTELGHSDDRSRAHHLSHYLLDRRSAQIQMRKDAASAHDESARRGSDRHPSGGGLSHFLLERRHATIQQRSSGSAGRENPHQAAARGTSSPATSLPHRDRIQASFGPDHDLSSIQAHVGGDSAAGMGAKAYATGNHVVFDSAPDLHTAAHEAAHVVQQSQGISLYGGVGKPGDEHERNADAVADRVVKGQSAKDLLGSPTAGAASRGNAIQMKEKAPWDFIPKQGVSTEDVVGAAANGGTLSPHGHDANVLAGDPTLDNAPMCEEPTGDPECFLDAHPTRRDLLRTRLAFRISNARENYKLALTNIKFETLLEKDEDLHWAASIAFELLAGRFLSFAQSALKVGRAGGIAALQDAELNTIFAGEPASKLNSLARTAMSKVSEQGLDTASRLPFEQVKAGTLATVKAGKNQAATDSRTAKLSFVNHLKNQSGIAFDNFVGRAIASSDADMVVLFRAMHPNNHTEEMYTTSLKERIDEFMQSGVTKIGREVFPQGKQNIERDVRVVYVRDMAGAITPWFQSQDGIEEIGSNLKTDFGPRFQNGPAKLRARVPDEFKEEAIARSEMIWGPIETIDDPNVAYMKSLGIEVLPPGSVFSSKTDDGPVMQQGKQLPRGSVFE